MDELRQWPLASHLHEVPTPQEVQRAVSQMSTCKAPSTDGIRSDIIKYGGKESLRHLTDLFAQIWSGESVPQYSKDTYRAHLQAQRRPSCLRQSPRHTSDVSRWQNPCTRPAKQTQGPHGQLCYYTGNPVWLPGGQMCHDNDLLSQTDTREVLRAASRSLYGIY